MSTMNSLTLVVFVFLLVGRSDVWGQRNLILPQIGAFEQQTMSEVDLPKNHPSPVHFATKIDLLWPIINQYRGRIQDFRFSIESELQFKKNQRISLVADLDFRVFEGYVDRFWRPNFWGTGSYREHDLRFSIGPRIYFFQKVFPQYPLQGFFLEPGVSWKYQFGEIVSPLLIDTEEKFDYLHFDWKVRVGLQGQVLYRFIISASIEFSNRQFPVEGRHLYGFLPEINVGYQFK